MSKTTVKKALEPLSRAQLVEMVLELYGARKEAKEYLDFWADPDVEKELEKAVAKINRLFFLSADKPRKKPKLTSIKTVIKAFADLVADRNEVCRLHVSMLEILRKWVEANDFRVSGGYPKWHSLIESAVTYASPESDTSPFAAKVNRETELTTEALIATTSPRPGRRFFRY